MMTRACTANWYWFLLRSGLQVSTFQICFGKYHFFIWLTLNFKYHFYWYNHVYRKYRLFSLKIKIFLFSNQSYLTATTRYFNNVSHISLNYTIYWSIIYFFFLFLCFYIFDYNTPPSSSKTIFFPNASVSLIHVMTSNFFFHVSGFSFTDTDNSRKTRGREGRSLLVTSIPSQTFTHLICSLTSEMSNWNFSLQRI